MKGIFLIPFLLGWTNRTGSQQEKPITTPPIEQIVYVSDTSPVYRLKAQNDSTLLAIEEAEPDNSKANFYYLSKRLAAYTYRTKQQSYKPKPQTVRDTILKVIYIEEDGREIEAPQEIKPTSTEVKKDSWFLRNFKKIFK